MAKRRSTSRLSAADLEQFRQHLNAARAAITGDMDQLAREAALDLEQAVGEVRDELDDLYSQEFNLELLQHDEGTLRQIVEALERMDAGEYGICQSCGEKVGKERLHAVPYARNCIACQREIEREAS